MSLSEIATSNAEKMNMEVDEGEQARATELQAPEGPDFEQAGKGAEPEKGSQPTPTVPEKEKGPVEPDLLERIVVQDAISSITGRDHRLKMARPEQTYVKHFYLQQAKPTLTATGLSNMIVKGVKTAIGNKQEILAGQVSSRHYGSWADIQATMPGAGNEQVDKVLEELEKVGIVATNGKISEMGSGFIVNEGFDWTDIGRHIELYLPDGKDVYVCDLTGYKIAE